MEAFVVGLVIGLILTFGCSCCAYRSGYYVGFVDGRFAAFFGRERRVKQ